MGYQIKRTYHVPVQLLPPDILVNDVHSWFLCKHFWVQVDEAELLFLNRVKVRDPHLTWVLVLRREGQLASTNDW